MSSSALFAGRVLHADQLRAAVPRQPGQDEQPLAARRDAPSRHDLKLRQILLRQDRARR
jgi:hypothetical protein